MDEDTSSIYEIARYVRMPGERIESFIKVLAMCGYEIKRKDVQPPDIRGESRG